MTILPVLVTSIAVACTLFAAIARKPLHRALGALFAISASVVAPWVHPAPDALAAERRRVGSICQRRGELYQSWARDRLAAGATTVPVGWEHDLFGMTYDIDDMAQLCLSEVKPCRALADQLGMTPVGSSMEDVNEKLGELGNAFITRTTCRRK